MMLRQFLGGVAPERFHSDIQLEDMAEDAFLFPPMIRRGILYLLMDVTGQIDNMSGDCSLVRKVIMSIAVPLVILSMLAVILSGLPLSSVALQRSLFVAKAREIARRLRTETNPSNLIMSGQLDIKTGGCIWHVVPLFYASEVKPFAITFWGREPAFAVDHQKLIAIVHGPSNVEFPYDLVYIVRISDGKVCVMPKLEPETLANVIQSIHDDGITHREFEL
jgi:hypothetical protein